MCNGCEVRRWRNEVPAEHQHRLRITANDLDEQALEELKAAHERFPPATDVAHDIEDDRYERPPTGTMVNGLFVMQNDARIALMEAAYQWVDLDPFGSPVHFLDAAIQGIVSCGVLGVTATDTAALTRVKCLLSTTQVRGQRESLIGYAHDDAVAVCSPSELPIATTAARHDRSIEPVLALYWTTGQHGGYWAG